MDPKEYRRKLEEDTPSLKAWGELVVATLSKKICSELGNDQFEEWVKIPPTYRVKKPKSFIAKAFVLNKGWFSCYEDIKDKVAARFVLGLSHQITKISELVQEVELWNATPCREFDEWKSADPRLFDYQSAHFHLESLEDIVHNETAIPAGTICELQLRTLLQHAYAELSHDTLYKSNIVSQPEIHRLFAKSMALMETTDDMLAKAKEQSTRAVAYVTSWRENIYNYTKQKQAHIKFNYEEREDDFVIDSISSLLKGQKFETALNFFSEEGNTFLSERIIKAQKDFQIFNTSSIYLVYFLAWRKPRMLPICSKFDIKMLAKVYTDLGIAPTWPST